MCVCVRACVGVGVWVCCKCGCSCISNLVVLSGNVTNNYMLLCCGCTFHSPAHQRKREPIPNVVTSSPKRRETGSHSGEEE